MACAERGDGKRGRHVLVDEPLPSCEAQPYRAHIVEQQHAMYPPAAHAVWREVLARNVALIEHCGARMHPAYVAGLRALALPMRVPQIEELNARLAPTGWETVCVDGYIPTSAYVGLMSRSVFPVSRFVRLAEHIDFAPEPDLVHDVLGHLPMLFCAEYREYLRRLARVMSRAESNELDREFFTTVRNLATIRSNPASPARAIAAANARMTHVVRRIAENASPLTHLRRLYVWSVEFGLLGTRDDFRVHGAALLSSPAEFRAVCAGEPGLRPFGIEVVEHENAFSEILNQYFIARDFAHLHEALSAYEARMTSKDDASPERR